MSKAKITDYYFKQAPDKPSTVKVNKFVDGELDTGYDVRTLDSGTSTCDCPANWRSTAEPCRHRQMVKEWLLLGDERFKMYAEYDEKKRLFLFKPNPLLDGTIDKALDKES